MKFGGVALVSATMYQPHNSMPRSIRDAICKRCSSRMVMGYDEMECIMCGHVDYSFSRKPTSGRKNLLSTATEYVLRYVGDFPALSETLTHVKVVRIRNRAGFDVKCPFCSRGMEEASPFRQATGGARAALQVHGRASRVPDTRQDRRGGLAIIWPGYTGDLREIPYRSPYN